MEVLVEIFYGILLSAWFWIVLFSVLLGCFLVFLYRRGQLYALGELEYGRAFTETVHNPTLFPLFSVEMSFFVPAGFVIDGMECREYKRIVSVFHIPPRASVRKEHVVSVKARGMYEMRSASVFYRKNEFPFSVPFRLYGFPRAAAVNLDELPALYRAGDYIASRKSIEDPFFLSEIRPYRIGDPMRAINFKASVRSFSGGRPQLMSNAYDSSRSFDTMIFLDLFSGDETTKETRREEHLERGLSFATYLLSETLKQGGTIGFASNCASGTNAYLHVPCASGAIHARRILECFASLSYTGRDYSIASLLEQIPYGLPPKTDIYLITPYVNLRTATVLSRLERTGRNVLVIPLDGRRV